MRSYKHPKAAEILFNECKIWEACRATTAATTFFDPIAIGSKGQKFLDGGVLYNNPVGLLHQEAQALWPDRDAFIISIGTGVAPTMAFKGNSLDIFKSLKNIAIETERTANNFFIDHKQMVDAGRYYRFNVTQGLAGIGLEEHEHIPTMVDVTETYLDGGEVRKKLDQCVARLKETETEGMHPLRAGQLQPLEAPISPVSSQPLLLEAPTESSHGSWSATEGSCEPQEVIRVFAFRR